MTLAPPTGMATYYRTIAPFYDAEMSIRDDLPGWRRFAPADAWLQRNMQIAQAPKPDEMRVMFSRFVDERRQASGSGPMTPQEKDELFQQFRAWQTGKSR